MEPRSVLEATLRGTGVVGVAFLAYSAGYTRAFITANGVEITSQKEIISLGGVPTWAGMMGFFGMGLILLFLIGIAVGVGEPR